MLTLIAAAVLFSTPVQEASPIPDCEQVAAQFEQVDNALNAFDELDPPELEGPVDPELIGE